MLPGVGGSETAVSTLSWCPQVSWMFRKNCYQMASRTNGMRLDQLQVGQLIGELLQSSHCEAAWGLAGWHCCHCGGHASKPPCVMCSHTLRTPLSQCARGAPLPRGSNGREVCVPASSREAISCPPPVPSTTLHPMHPGTVSACMCLLVSSGYCA